MRFSWLGLRLLAQQCVSTPQEKNNRPDVFFQSCTIALMLKGGCLCFLSCLEWMLLNQGICGDAHTLSRPRVLVLLFIKPCWKEQGSSQAFSINWRRRSLRNVHTHLENPTARICYCCREQANLSTLARFKATPSLLLCIQKMISAS